MPLQSLALVLIPFLLSACQPTGLGDLPPVPETPIEEQPAEEVPPEPAFDTHVVAYGNSLDGLDQDCLRAFDLIILEAQAFAGLEPRFRSRALLYFNPWGKSSHTDSLRGWTEWQPAPGELGEPDIVLNGSVHCYRFDDAHVLRFLGWIEGFLAEYGDSVAGILLDDFGYNRDWWEGAEADKDSVWGPWDGAPGWRDAPYEWSRQRILDIEAGARDLVHAYCGENGVMVVNGIARNFDDVRRCAENVGAPSSEAWDRLEDAGVDVTRYVRAGDLLQVNGIGASGAWEDWCHSAAGYGEDNLIRACALALERGASVGLAYGVDPLHGGSRYSLFLPPDHSGQEWPGYFPVTP